MLEDIVQHDLDLMLEPGEVFPKNTGDELDVREHGESRTSPRISPHSSPQPSPPSSPLTSQRKGLSALVAAAAAASDFVGDDKDSDGSPKSDAEIAAAALATLTQSSSPLIGRARSLPPPPPESDPAVWQGFRAQEFGSPARLNPKRMNNLHIASTPSTASISLSAHLAHNGLIVPSQPLERLTAAGILYLGSGGGSRGGSSSLLGNSVAHSAHNQKKADNNNPVSGAEEDEQEKNNKTVSRRSISAPLLPTIKTMNITIQAEESLNAVEGVPATAEPQGTMAKNSSHHNGRSSPHGHHGHGKNKHKSPSSSPKGGKRKQQHNFPSSPLVASAPKAAGNDSGAERTHEGNQLIEQNKQQSQSGSSTITASLVPVAVDSKPTAVTLTVVTNGLKAENGSNPSVSTSVVQQGSINQPSSGQPASAPPKAPAKPQPSSLPVATEDAEKKKMISLTHAVSLSSLKLPTQPLNNSPPAKAANSGIKLLFAPGSKGETNSTQSIVPIGLNGLLSSGLRLRSNSREREEPSSPHSIGDRSSRALSTASAVSTSTIDPAEANDIEEKLKADGLNVDMTARLNKYLAVRFIFSLVEYFFLLA